MRRSSRPVSGLAVHDQAVSLAVPPERNLGYQTNWEPSGHIWQRYTGDQPLEAAAAQGIRLEVVKLPQAKKGFVLLPRRFRGGARLWLDGAFSPLGAGL